MSKLATRIKKIGWLFKGIIWSAFALLLLVLAVCEPKKGEDTWSGIELSASGIQGQLFYSLVGIMMGLYGLFKLSYILLLWIPPRNDNDDLEEQEEVYKPSSLEGIAGTLVYLGSSSLYVLFGVTLMYIVYAVEKENNKWSDRLFLHHPFLIGFLIVCFLIACLLEGLKLAPGAFKVGSLFSTPPFTVNNRPPSPDPLPASDTPSCNRIIEENEQLGFGGVEEIEQEQQQHLNQHFPLYTQPITTTTTTTPTTPTMTTTPNTPINTAAADINANPVVQQQKQNYQQTLLQKHLLEDQMSLSRKLAVHVTGYIGICGRAMLFLLLVILFCCLAANSDMDVTTLVVRLESSWMGPTLFVVMAICFACFGAHVFLSLPYKTHKPGYCIAE